MSSNLSWMLNEKILLLEYEGQSENSLMDETFVQINHMVEQTSDKKAYLLVDMSKSNKSISMENIDYTFLSQFEGLQIKGVILICDPLSSLKPLSQHVEEKRRNRPIPQVLFGTDRDAAFNYLVQIVGNQSSQAHALPA